MGSWRRSVMVLSVCSKAIDIMISRAGGPKRAEPIFSAAQIVQLRSTTGNQVII